MRSRVFGLRSYTVVLALFMCLVLSSAIGVEAETLSNGHDEKKERTATLDECIKTAIENNHLRPASRFAVDMAEAQHRQALAGYWPQVGAKGGYQRMDEASNFLFPASDIVLPNGGTIPITIPGVGEVPVNAISIPGQNVTLMDEESYRASLEATWLLYDGGMRKGYRKQAEAQVKAMKEEVRRTDLAILDSVHRHYFGAVLATRLHTLGKETLARMEATLFLTETMYKEGGGKVKKTDWLDNKVMVETLRSMVAVLEKNDLMAKSALANTMGMSWNATVNPADKDLPYTPLTLDLDNFVGTAYRFNPDWGKVEAGIMAAEGALKTAKSGYFPKLAFTGELFKWWNDYDAGMATDENKEGWNVGIGVEIPLFSGFLTKNKVAQKRAGLAKIKEEKILLKEGIGLMIKDTVLSIHAAQKTYQATESAMEAAVESRDLNIRAYQNELVETEDVVTAQLTEALMSAQHEKAIYEHIALKSRLNLVVGTEVMKIMKD